MVTCQFSLYPLRSERVSPALDAALDELRALDLEPQVGPMSTTFSGESLAVFEGLRRAFDVAASHGDVVLTATVSNACDVPAR